MNKPSIGRIVLVSADPERNNGADEAPAVITRVFGPDMINVRVLLDGNDVDWMTSVELHDAKPQGDDAQPCAWWPPRV